MIKGEVNGQELVLSHAPIASGSVDYLTATFSFSEDWFNADKFCYFKKDDQVWDIKLEKDMITADKHLNLTEGIWRVSLHGITPDGSRITTCNQIIKVYPTGFVGVPLPEIPPSQAEQISQNAADAKRISEETRQLVLDNQVYTQRAEAAAGKAEQHEANAKQVATDVQGFVDQAQTSEQSATSSALIATEKASLASTSEVNANVSKLAALKSETNAKESETNAKASETVIVESLNEAKGHANASALSETNAKTSEDNAKASETASANSVLEAQGKVDLATEQVALATAQVELAKAEVVKAQAEVTKAQTEANNAKTSAIDAKTSEENALASKQAAEQALAKMENKADKQEVANVIKVHVFGKEIDVNDVIQFPHEINCKVESKNIISPIAITKSDTVAFAFREAGIVLKGGESYVFSVNSPVDTIGFVDFETKKFVVKNNNVSSIVYAPSKDIKVYMQIVQTPKLTVGITEHFQLERGTVATPFTPYMGNLAGIQISVTGTGQIEPATYTTGEDGSVQGVKAVFPSMRIVSNSENISLNATYGIDTKVYIDKKFEALQQAFMALGGIL